MIDVFDSVHNPKRWKYLPPPWIESVLPEDMFANVFSRLFKLDKLDIK
jgi:hypothetical protein